MSAKKAHSAMDRVKMFLNKRSKSRQLTEVQHVKISEQSSVMTDVEVETSVFDVGKSTTIHGEDLEDVEEKSKTSTARLSDFSKTMMNPGESSEDVEEKEKSTRKRLLSIRKSMLPPESLEDVKEEVSNTPLSESSKSKVNEGENLEDVEEKAETSKGQSIESSKSGSKDAQGEEVETDAKAEFIQLSKNKIKQDENVEGKEDAFSMQGSESNYNLVDVQEAELSGSISRGEDREDGKKISDISEGTEMMKAMASKDSDGSYNSVNPVVDPRSSLDSSRSESSGKLVRTTKCMQLVTKPIDQLVEEELHKESSMRYGSPSDLSNSIDDSMWSYSSVDFRVYSKEVAEQEITTELKKHVQLVVDGFGDENAAIHYDTTVNVVKSEMIRHQCTTCTLGSQNIAEELTLRFVSFVPYPKMRQQMVQNPSNTFSISWKFMDKEDSFRMPRYLADDRVPIDVKRSYPLKMTKLLRHYLSRCPLLLELHHSIDDVPENRLISTGRLNFRPGLENLGKVFEVKLELNNDELKKCYMNLHHEHCGILVVRFSVSGEPMRMSSFKTPKLGVLPRPTVATSETEIDKSKWGETEVDQDNLDELRHNLALSLVRNKLLRSTSDNASEQLDRHIDWIHKELYWQLTLQENAVLAGEDPKAVLWRQWRNDDNEMVCYRPTCGHRFRNDARLEIVLERLKLYSFSYAIYDDSVNDVYLEYAFLDHSGVDMETPSKPKTTDIIFDFHRTFFLPLGSNAARMFLDMVLNKEELVVNVLCEPKAEVDYVQASWEIGRCVIKICDLLHEINDTVREDCPVMNDDGEEIGVLRVSLAGVFSLRSLALHMLAPKDFTIIR